MSPVSPTVVEELYYVLKGSGPEGAEIQNHLSLKRSASQEVSPCLLGVLP